MLSQTSFSKFNCLFLNRIHPSYILLFHYPSFQPVKLKKQANLPTTITTTTNTTTTTASTSDTAIVKIESSLSSTTTKTIPTPSSTATKSLLISSIKKIVTVTSTSSPTNLTPKPKNMITISSSTDANRKTIFVNTSPKITMPSFVSNNKLVTVSSSTHPSNKNYSVKMATASAQSTTAKPSSKQSVVVPTTKISLSNPTGSAVKPTFVVKSPEPNSKGFTQQKILSSKSVAAIKKMSPLNTLPKTSGSVNKIVTTNAPKVGNNNRVGPKTTDKNIIDLTSESQLPSHLKPAQSVFVAVTDVKLQTTKTPQPPANRNTETQANFKPTKVSNNSNKSPIVVTNILKSPLQQQKQQQQQQQKQQQKQQKGLILSPKNPDRVVSNQQQTNTKNIQISPSTSSKSPHNVATIISKSINQQKSPSSSSNYQDTPTRTFVTGRGGVQNHQQRQHNNRTPIEVQQIKSNASNSSQQQQQQRATSSSPSLGIQHFSSSHMITSPPPLSSNHQNHHTTQSLLSSSHPSVINSKNLMNKSPSKVITHQQPRRSSLPEKLDSKSLSAAATYTNHGIADLTDLHSQYKKIKDQNEIRQNNTATIQHLKQTSLGQSAKEQQQQLQHHPSKKLQQQQQQQQQKQQQQQQIPYHFSNVISSPPEKLRHTPPVASHINTASEPKMSWLNSSPTNDTRKSLHHRTDTETIIPSSSAKNATSRSPPPRYEVYSNFQIFKLEVPKHLSCVFVLYIVSLKRFFFQYHIFPVFTFHFVFLAFYIDLMSFRNICQTITNSKTNSKSS